MLRGFEDQNLMYRLRGIRQGEIEQILLKNQLYFAAPDTLNDPSEAQPDIVFSLDAKMSNKEVRSMVSRQMRGASFSKRFEHGIRIKNSYNDKNKREEIKETLTSWFRKMLAESSLCCFFQQPRITHWAHYGANHAGFCLAFDRSTRFPYTMPTGSLLLHDGEEIAMQVEPIAYVEENEFPTVDMDANWRDDPTDSWSVYRTALLTKSIDWSGEGELRAIRPAVPAGLQEFDPQNLRAIVVGTHAADSFVTEVLRVATTRRISLPVYKASIVRGKFQPEYERIG